MLHAIAAEPTFVVTASRAASVDVTFRSPTRLRADSLRADLHGTFAALYIARLDSSSTKPFLDLLVLVNPSLFGAALPPAVLGTDDEPLPPGRYRVSLLTDGRATVRVPLDAGAPMSLRPTRSVSVQRRLVTAPIAGVPYVATASHTLKAGSRPLIAVMGTAQFADRAADIHDLTTCLPERSGETPCSSGDPRFGYGTHALNATAGVERASTYATQHDDLRRGTSQTCAVEYRGLTKPVSVRLFVLAASGVY